MKIFTLDSPDEIFPGACLPLRRTHDEAFYVKPPSGGAVFVSIDLLLSEDTKILNCSDLTAASQLLVMRASVTEREDGNYQLIKEISPSQTMKDIIKQDNTDMVLLWIPFIEDVPWKLMETTYILEESPNQKGKCHPLQTWALLCMEPSSSFSLSTHYRNHKGETIRQDRIEITYVGQSDFLIDSQPTRKNQLKWS